MMSPTDQIKALRLLRYARVGEPTTLTKDRRRVLDMLLRAGHVEVAGSRRSGTLLRLTKDGQRELSILEEANPGQQDFATSQAVRRAVERGK